eukprot:15365231-Ditylum_brightwellii.AAC.1
MLAQAPAQKIEDNTIMQASQFQIIAGGKKMSKRIISGEVGKYGNGTIVGDDISILLKRSVAAKKADVSLTAIKSPVAEKCSKQEYWNRLVVNGPVLLSLPTATGHDISNALDLTTSPCGTPPMAKCI